MKEIQPQYDFSLDSTGNESNTKLQESGDLNFSRLRSILLARLFRWNEWMGMGEVFDSAAQFELDNGQLLEASLSWVPKEDWAKVGRDEFSKNLKIVPRFVGLVCEEKGKGLDLAGQWNTAGAQLIWLILPTHKEIFVYSPGAALPASYSFQETLSGKDILPGFLFEAKEFLAGI